MTKETTEIFKKDVSKFDEKHYSKGSKCFEDLADITKERPKCHQVAIGTGTIMQNNGGKGIRVQVYYLVRVKKTETKAFRSVQ